MWRVILQTVNWDHVVNNEGIYQLKDSRELFFISKRDEVSYYVPDEQSIGSVVNHNFWANSYFVAL
jgi:hypothetical protein